MNGTQIAIDLALLTIVALGFVMGLLVGYRSCERYWRGRDRWFQTAETISEQMHADGWERP